jgi:hypothetical protein
MADKLLKKCGHPQTPETRAKISASHMGHKASPETRRKNAEAQRNRSPETQAKMTAAQVGHKASAETREKMSISARGKTRTPETRAKISAIHKKIPMSEACRLAARSPEARAKSSLLTWKGGKQISHRKSKAKRRDLGLHPLNSWFVGCDGHHINKEDVIYIPEVIHDSVSHDIWTGRNMEKINALAMGWLGGTNGTNN